jgi:recombinational DNA repair ATPase RecF
LFRKNGIGKTNVLDAIILRQKLFQSTGSQNIKHGEEFFVVDAEFIKKMRNEQVVCSLKKGQKSIKAQWQSLRQIFRPCRFYSLGNHFACRSGFDCRRQ